MCRAYEKRVNPQTVGTEPEMRIQQNVENQVAGWATPTREHSSQTQDSSPRSRSRKEHVSIHGVN
jgi:hypothetical protein